MDITIQQLMNHHNNLPVDAYNLACDLLANGHDAPVLTDMIRMGTVEAMPPEMIDQILTIIDHEDMKDYQNLRRHYEGQLIQEYLKGNLDGRLLIQQCCDLYAGDYSLEPVSCRFWSAIADDADMHGGQCCIEFKFNIGDFDQVLRSALISHHRPNADTVPTK